MTKLVRKPTTTVVHGEDGVELGQWYWVKDDDAGWLGCVTRVGSNYVSMTGVSGSSMRIHFDDFEAKCWREHAASGVIERKVLEQKDEVRRLMAEVVAITARLGVGQSPALGSGSEGSALARLDPKQDVKVYKTALVKAKTEELPELFKKIEAANDELATWMKAETLPLRAQLGKMKGVIGRIDDRIFNVELYAGLTEQVEQIADGDPAPMLEKVRLMQRRCYMDEECLAHYEIGGMEFGDLSEFDAWLAKPVNRDRILPFPRCIVSFRVRRNAKWREIHSFIDFFSAIEKIEADRLTFLYIRNGDRLYRMNTEIKFDENLFPDTDHSTLTAGTKLWAKMFADRVDHVITDAQYQGLREDYAAQKAKHKVASKVHAAQVKAWRAAKKAADAAGQVFKEREPHLSYFWDRDPADEHQPFEPNNIYYDDVARKIAAEIQQANRIAIVIQGLLDRSMVLHPHPPWKIWDASGAEQALELIYDSTRALVGGEKPDFEAYRARLNASLKVGSVTVGQRHAWNSEDPDERKKRHYSDPGPDQLARVATFQPSKQCCVYAWHRESEAYDSDKKIRVRFVCGVDQVLNVDAYTPGDFRKFFADPRTRADYLQWAPLLLEAEEYHAGNRKAEDPPPPSKRAPSWEGQRAYRRRLERQRLVGKMVQLARKVTTTGGSEYAKGSLWFVTASERGKLNITQLSDKGEDLKGDNVGHVRGMDPSDLILVE
jgi:hypothetical protein